MARRTRQQAARIWRGPVALAVIAAVCAGYWWRGHYLDAEARALFAPEFGDHDEAFDLDKTLFEGKPIAKLIEQARHGSAHERADAILGLHHVHHGCHRHCMHSMHRAPPSEIRRQMLALAEGGRIGQRAPLLLPTLIEGLKDTSAEVRGLAAFALMSMNAEALSSCDALTNCLVDADSSVRLWAARALYFIRFETEAPIAVSLDILQHSAAARDRSMAAYNLTLMGSDAESAVPTLQTMQNDQTEDVARAVTQALESIQKQPR